MTPSALEAQRILRDGSLFQWYVIPLFALVVYVYAAEVERRNWNLVLAGLAFWGWTGSTKRGTAWSSTSRSTRPFGARPARGISDPGRPEHRNLFHVRRCRHHFHQAASC